MSASKPHKLPESGRHREVSAAASDRRAPSNQHSTPEEIADAVRLARGTLEDIATVESDANREAFELFEGKLARAVISLFEQLQTSLEVQREWAAEAGRLQEQLEALRTAAEEAWALLPSQYQAAEILADALRASNPASTPEDA